MNTTLKTIKKIKANLVRVKIHRLFGPAANLILYFGYLVKMSKWIEKNKAKLRYNDFYNKKVVHIERVKLHDFVRQEYKLTDEAISYLEFGVGEGKSMRWWTSNNHNGSSEFWGFDTFVGLPEKYGNYEVGSFTQEGNYPKIEDDRIHFVKGLFQETLLDRISEIDFSKKCILHLDADLYSSTIFTLGVLYPYLKKGDILLFDEFVVPLHEFRAFDDFVKSFYIKLEPIGAINNYLQVAFEVTEVGGRSKP